MGEDLQIVGIGELSAEALSGLIKSFVDRHPGQTTTAVQEGLTTGQLRVVWDPYEQSSHILTQDELKKISAIHGR